MRSVAKRCVRLLTASLLLVLPALAGRSAADTLRYVVRSDPFEVELTLPDGTKHLKRPARDATHFFLLAEDGWPVPDGAASTRVRCEIRWSGFSAGWRLVNSFGVDRRTQEFDTTLGELRKAVFAGGDFRVTRSRKGLLVVTRATWRFPDVQAADLVDRIAQAQTDIWRDRGLAGHLVYLLATDEAAGQWGGEARTRSTVLQISRDTAHASNVADAFAHELFHEWNAHRLNRPEDERLYWFTEGFTDYYAVITLWRSGLWNIDRVIDAFNAVARLYFGSSVRNLTADRMVERRKADFNAERLPYQQGFLLAAHWNAGGRILDHAMRNLLKTNREPLSNRRIAAALRDAGIANADSEIERFVMKGETIVLRPGIWGVCATETTLEVRQFDMGFDVEQSKRTRIIHGVSPGSNAWQAGVRDGQEWAPMDVAWGDPARLAELEIRDGQGTRRARYYPAASNAVSAPQYTAIATPSCHPGARAVSR